MFIINYGGTKKEIDVDLENPNIIVALMEVISGDEVLTVIRKTNDGYSTDVYDSSDDRWSDFFDYSYLIIVQGEWQIDKNAFYSRPDPYFMEV